MSKKLDNLSNPSIYFWIKRVPPGYWKKKSNRTFYMKWLERKLGFNSPEDWYGVTRDTFANNHGATLVSYFAHFPYDIVKEFNPNFSYKKWLFAGSVGNDFWEDIENVRKYMTWLRGKVPIKTNYDWYNELTTNTIRKYRGWGLLKHYKMSRAKLLKDCYRNYDWKFYLFDNVSPGSWQEKRNRFEYMGWLKVQLNIQKPEDWYNVKRSDIYKHKGRTLLKYYKNYKELIQEYNSNYNYLEWKFAETPKQYWFNSYNRKRYLFWLGEHLGFKKAKDWYDITIRHFRDNHGRGLLAYYGDQPAEIVIKNIEWNWDIEKFTLGLKTQKHLFKIIKSIYANKEVRWNYWHPDLIFSDSGARMQLDIFVVEENIAFEYQGEQHFKPNPRFGGKQAYLQLVERDKEKRQACQDAGIKLFEVKYTWKQTEKEILKLTGSL